jgi:hypothetical protein
VQDGGDGAGVVYAPCSGEPANAQAQASMTATAPARIRSVPIRVSTCS